jgi:hypothetical protein
MKTQKKIKPPMGYRLMRPGEKPSFLRGDKFLYHGEWLPTSASGAHTVKQKMNDLLFVQAYARKEAL